MSAQPLLITDDWLLVTGSWPCPWAVAGPALCGQFRGEFLLPQTDIGHYSDRAMSCQVSTQKYFHEFSLRRKPTESHGEGPGGESEEPVRNPGFCPPAEKSGIWAGAASEAGRIVYVGNAAVAALLVYCREAPHCFAVRGVAAGSPRLQAHAVIARI